MRTGFDLYLKLGNHLEIKIVAEPYWYYQNTNHTL